MAEAYFPCEGTFAENDIFSLLFSLYKNDIACRLKIENGQVEKELLVEDRKVIFASSNLKEDSLGYYFLKSNVITEETYNRVDIYIKSHGKRFGRALVELGIINYEQLWAGIKNQLLSIIFSIFQIPSGRYQIQLDYAKEVENIVLDLDIPRVIVEGIRRLDNPEFIAEKFREILFLYRRDNDLANTLPWREYERHVYDLLKRETELEKILAASELQPADTLRILYLFWILELATPDSQDKQQEILREDDGSVSLTSFKSFEEALRYYNAKYEFIYRILLKEIGPISLSILWRAIEEIDDVLPSYLKKTHLNPNGTVDESLILKSLWYHDFDKNAREFLRGLEEIFHAEIFVIKKHLGPEYEQMVYECLNGNEE